jgi:hypothetical protein
VTILCGYSFGYPIGFNEPAFEELKLALLKSTQITATAEQARNTPFYVIVLTRVNNTPLSPQSIGGIREILDNLLQKENLERVPDKLSSILDKILKSLGIGITDEILKSLGIVITNEYFFSGKSPMDSAQEAQIGTSFSSISPRYIFAINSLTRSQGQFDSPSLARREVHLPTNNLLTFPPTNLIQAAAKITHPNYLGNLSSIFSGKRLDPPAAVNSLVQISTNLGNQLIPEGIAGTITNRTIFWYHGIPGVQWCKRTYAMECDKEISEGYQFVLGDPKRDPYSDSKPYNHFEQLIKDNFDVQICADHQYGIGVEQRNPKNFQILQSNTCASIPQMCSSVLHADNPEQLRKFYQQTYKERLVSSSKGVKSIDMLYPHPYFIHADGGAVTQAPFSINMYSREEVSRHRIKPYLQPSPAIRWFQFTLDGEKFRIEIHKISQ